MHIDISLFISRLPRTFSFIHFNNSTSISYHILKRKSLPDIKLQGYITCRLRYLIKGTIFYGYKNLILPPTIAFWLILQQWFLLQIFWAPSAQPFILHSNSIIQSTSSPVPQSDTGLLCGYCSFIQRLFYTTHGWMSIVTTKWVYIIYCNG